MPNPDFSQVNTRTWRATLGSTSATDASAVEWLRVEFFKLRSRAALLLGEIQRDLPDFTRHDLSHCDALWEMADLVGAADQNLNPAEGFILGAVFLLHDAALSVAALPDRFDELRGDPLWADIAAVELRKQLRRTPTTQDVESVRDGHDSSLRQWIDAAVLRSRHAIYAEGLASREYVSSGGEAFHLIENEVLRTHFGRDIGRIASSHGTSLSEVIRVFAAQPPLGAPAGSCPAEWQVDRFKLACLIRICDAIHIDSRRAPGFLRAMRQPSDHSDPHWQFQRRITVARDGERVRFSSGYAFPPSEALAWWTGYELIQNADRELRQVNVALSELQRPHLAVNRVFGAESPARLESAIPTDGWEPVEARVRISNVLQVARTLGGENLYGQHNRRYVPLRELIQNAADAVRARRLLEARERYARLNLGEIIVRQGKDELGRWIEVEDNGLGMSSAVLTGSLLDFGASFWHSASQHFEWPTLSSEGFESVGQYGIGFFSVFMWGNRVRVVSRRYDQARDTTRVLEWEKGIDWHPILRVANAEEYISDGGTTVRVWIAEAAEAERHRDDDWDLAGICAALCPTLDVNLVVEESSVSPETSDPHGSIPTRTTIILGGDWLTCDGKELLRRTWLGYHRFDSLRSPELLQAVADALRPLHSNHQAVGRACIFDWRLGFEMFSVANYRTGCVTVGGFRGAELTGIAGVLTGSSLRAARDEARPTVGADELARWATEQAGLFTRISSNFDHQIGASRTVRACGGHTGPLYITACGHPDGWVQLSHDDIVEMENFPDEVVFLDFDFFHGLRFAESVRLRPNVFLTNFDSPSLLMRTEYLRQFDWTLDPPARVAQVESPEWQTRYSTLFGALIEAAAARWGCTVNAVLLASTLVDPPSTPPIEREIAVVDGRPITQAVGLLRKPPQED